MKELSDLKNEFYEVMYKYEKSFSEDGVMANLTAWQTAKADLISLLRHHPDWNEAEQAIIFDCNQALSIQPDMVDETAFTLLDIASEILSGEQLENFRTALHAAVSGYSRTVSEENLEILRQRGGIRCTSDQKASRIIGKLCRKFGVDRHDRYNAVFAQLADALNPLIMQETGVLSVHPCDFLEMSSKSNTWMSCHRLNGGGYQAGCLSYMNDTLIGVMPAALLMILVGAIMSIGTGNYDVAAMFAGLGLPIVAMLVLILATWTTNTGNAYMSGLAACKMFSIKDSKRPLVTMICGVLGVIMAIAGLADFLNTYISILGAVVPPIMGVVICDYWVICKAKKENWSPVRGINWIGIIAWVIGGGFALLETLGVVTVFSSALDGVIIAFAAYWILYSLLKNTKLAGSGDMTIEEACSVAQ